MIRKSKYENFKGLRLVEADFDSRLTVLVGPNASGKTSVLQGIELVIELWDRVDSVPKLADFTSAGDNANQLVLLVDETDSGFGIQHVWVPSNDHIQGPFVRSISGRIVSCHQHATTATPFSPVFRPQFRSTEIARASITLAAPPPLRHDGAGLPSLSAYMALTDEHLINRIEGDINRVIPNLRKLRFNRGLKNGGIGETNLFDTTLARRIPADQMSDGTLCILALVVAILGPHRPRTLLIDDIDLRLHPKAQYELVTLLKEYLSEFPDLQIIATSHSPYILDKLESNEVLVTGLDEDGSVVVARLDEHPSFEKWKASMTPGEFWSHTGEEWLKNLRRSKSVA